MSAAATLPEGASAPSEVSPDAAAKAAAEVKTARSGAAAPTPIGPSGPAPKRRGRPPGSKNKSPSPGTVAAPSPATVATVEEVAEPADPEEFAEIVDLFNLVCEANQVEPVPEEAKKLWSEKAAKVANRWGGTLPLLPELSLIGCSVAIFGPRIVMLTDPAHKATVQAKAAQAAEEERAKRGDMPPPPGPQKKK